MKKIFSIIIIFLLLNVGTSSGQIIGIKTNLLYDATSTINLGVEVGLSSKFTLDLSGNYNPWEFSDNKKMRHWLIQPEIRYWFCEKFNGHFIGLHGHYAVYNFGGMKIFGMENYRYEGELYGGGISYGYHHILNKRWSMSFSIGVGFIHLDYDKYENRECEDLLSSPVKNYWGPTKANVSLIYTIK